MNNSIQNRLKKVIHSFFWRFFSSYIILFLIPFSTILITYNYAANSIEKSILRSNYNILHQFFLNVDGVFSEMNLVSTPLTNSYITQDFAMRSTYDLSKPSIDGYYLTQFIDSFEQDEFENIFIIFHKLSKIYNYRNGLSIDEFYQTYYDTIPAEDFEHFRSYPFSNYKTEIVSLNNDILQPLLGVAFSMPTSRNFFGAPDITSVITLSPEKLSQLFNSSLVHSDGILMIFDHSNHLLAASSPISEEILDAYTGDNQIYYGNYEGQDYVFQFFPSQVTDCTFASAIPVSAFWEQLNELRFISLISGLLCVSLSCFLAWKMAKLNYSPINGILKTITGSTKAVYNSRENEMEFINNVLTNSLKEVNSLTKKLEVQVDTLRSNFLMQAMLGKLPEDTADTKEDAFLQHHITLRSDMFGIIFMYVEEMDSSKLGDIDLKQNQKILDFIITNVAQELCLEKHQGFLITTEARYYACIINFSKDAEARQQNQDMRAIAKQCSVFLKQHFDIVITCCLSEVHSNLPGIHTGYLEVQETLNYRYLYGKGSLIGYDDIRNRDFDFISMDEKKLEHLLLSFIKDAQSPGSGEQIVDDIRGQSGINHNSSLEAISCYKYNLFIHLSRIIHQLGASAVPETDRLHTIIVDTDTLADMQTGFANILTALRQYYQDAQKTFTICDEVEEYLQKSFQNPELSNMMLGELFHISHSYLSRMYKIQKHISISDYLYQLRIRHAKELLETTNHTLEDIALDSGFLSSSTFIKVFKRNEGITPGAYRKLKQG